jgi:hypothetical protein
MTANLTREVVAALHAVGDRELEIVDPDTQRTYVVVDATVHRRAMEALRRQQDRDAIAEGLAQMEAGDGKPIDEAFAGIFSRLGLPQPK